MRSIGKYMRLVMSLILACLVLAQPVFADELTEVAPAVDPINNSDDYSAVLYDNTNGLPTAEANDIVQTSEGFIWIGCYAGLIRYDGNTFERLDSTGGVSSISDLMVDSKDRLWVGTNDNGVALMENGEFRFWDESDGLGSSKVTDIEEDGDGCIYVGTTSGIVMFDQDLKIRKLTDERISDMYVELLTSSRNELIYGLSNDDDLFILRDGNLVNYYENDQTLISGISTVYPDPKVPNKVYYGTDDSGVYHVDVKAGLEDAEHIDVDPLHSLSEIKQVGDQLWVMARNGIGVIDENGFHDLTDLPLNNSVGHMMMDYEGNLWFTSTRQGVMKLVPNRFSDVFERYGLQPMVVNSTCMSGGRLFIGTDTGLIVTDKDGVLDSIPLTSVATASGVPAEGTDLLKMLEGCRIRSIIRDSKERLWISTWESLGLLCYDDGKVTVYNEDEGLLSSRIRSVFETRDGRMLAAVTGGVNIIEDGKVTASYDADDGILNEETLMVTEAPNGDILAGSNGGGIYIINKDGVRNIDKKDGLTSSILMRIKYDEKNHVFWLVTGNSLAYMTEDYKVTTVDRFPYPDNLDVVENSKGDLWILSSDGIYVAPASELLANGEIDPVHYGMANGIKCITTSNPYNELTADGDLYIAGRSGVVKVNIEESLEEINDLKMAVPYIEFNDRRVYPDEDGTFRIPATARKLTVHGFVFNYSLTDPMVSFKLDGFDRDMMTVKRSEFGPIYYTNLRGGTYTFVMELQDAMGRGSKTLETKIIKEKAVFERLWFIIASLAGVALLIAYWVRSYIRNKVVKLEKQHKEESERQRVTGELQMASQIQSGMLPKDSFPERTEFDLYASMTPAREVGGDFYDYFLVDDDHLCLVMADVSGKGIPASLFMMTSKVLLKSLALGAIPPSEVLETANREICKNNQMEMFVTVWLGILELSTGRLTAANAGHEYPVIGRVNGSFELIKDKHGFVVGGMDGMKYTDYELQLEPGDKLFLYTDGVPEATNSENEMFGTDRMLEVLNSDMSASPWKMLREIEIAVNGFMKGAERFDDLTMLGFEYFGPQGEEK